MKLEANKFTAYTAYLKEKSILLADNLPLIPHLLAKIELHQNILPIAQYITREVFIHGKMFKNDNETFELDFKREKSGRAIRSAIIYDSRHPEKSFLTIYAEPKPRNRRTKSVDYSGFQLTIEDGKPETFSVIKNANKEVVFIENGKLTEVGKKMPLATILAFRSCLMQTAVEINKKFP